MTRFSQRFNPRSRPWLVLWLLPYLVLSVVAAVHNHGFGSGAAGHHAAPAVAERAASADVPSVFAAPFEAASHAAHELSCLACQWAGFATALLSSSVFLLLVAATLPVARLVLLSSRRAPARIAVRGPPAR